MARGQAGAARLGHLARRALLRLPDPGRAGQVLLRLARRADRLPREPQGATCARHAACDFAAFLARPDAEQLHFIGKDIIYFHALFWPAMLKFAGAPYKVPDNVHVNGFLTVNGDKMSKSRGTFISPRRYLDARPRTRNGCATTSPPSSTRGVEDLDFNLDDFLARVNSDLVGKYVNIASRAAPASSRGTSTAILATPAGPTTSARTALPSRSSSGEISARELRGARVRSRAARRDAHRRPPQRGVRRGAAVAAGQGPREARCVANDASQIAARRSAQLTVLLTPVLPSLAGRVARELFGMDRDFVWSDAGSRRRACVRSST